MKLETMVLGPLETNCYLLWDEQTMEAAVIDPRRLQTVWRRTA